MSRTVSVRRLLALVAAVALAIPASLTAQVKFQVVPFFTSYYAVGNIADKSIKNVDFSNPPDGVPDPVTIKEKQGNGPGLGVRARAWINPQFGFEGSFAYIWTGRQAKADPTTLFAASFVDGNAILLSGRVLYRPRRSNLHLLAGAGYMSLGGDAWDVKKFTAGTKLKTNNIFGVVGFGARASITPKLALDVGVEANLYSVDRVKTPAGTIDIFDSKFQSDILVSIGVPFGGR